MPKPTRAVDRTTPPTPHTASTPDDGTVRNKTAGDGTAGDGTAATRRRRTAGAAAPQAAPSATAAAPEATAPAGDEHPSPARGGAAGKHKGDGGDGARPKRRQARGERRIAQLLDAAADVFCSTGYAAASTNAIAREAGVSPGTLYQFFPNKEAIAFELGDRLMHQWRESHGAALAAAALDLPLEQLLDAVLDPLIAFNHENPAFAVLMHGPDIPGRITQEFDTVHQGLLARIEDILAGYLPGTPPEEVARVSTMTFAIFKAGLDLIVAHEGAERVAYTAELKAVMFRYLEPLLGEASGACSP